MRMVNKIRFAMVAFILINCSCSKEDMGKYPFEINDLTYRGKLVFNNEFRRDGYYYNLNDYNDLVSNNRIIYFFNDGYECKFSTKSKLILDSNFIAIDDVIKERPWYWGCYIVEPSRIYTQMYSSNRQTSKFRAFEKHYEIINDTTIKLYKTIYDKGRLFKKIYYDVEIYRFQATKGKPDSTNILMEY